MSSPPARLLSSVGKGRKKRLKYTGWIDRYLTKLRGKDMTYILGARCIDGVVLVGDTKVTIEEGADYAFAKKVTTHYNAVAMGSAGIGGLFKDFQNKLITKINEKAKELKQITTEEEFSVLVNEVIRNMHQDYDEDRHLIINNLIIICAMRIANPHASLTVFNPYGFPEPVNEKRAIGHGEPYGALFLRKMWSKNMTMEQTAKLGIFIIKFIQDMRLDNSVGFNDEFPPQVVYVPDVKVPDGFDWTNTNAVNALYQQYPLKELSNEEVQHFINEIGSKISDFENLFKQGKFKI